MKINVGLINISLVDGCNLSCRWCDRPDDFTYQSIENLNIIVDKINQGIFHSPLLQIIGSGEAFIHKDVVNALRVISKIKIPGMRKEIWTNGTVTKKDTFELIFKENLVDGIVISFDGYGDKESFEFMRKGAKFERVISNVSKFVNFRDSFNSRCEIGISCIYPTEGMLPFEHVDIEIGRKKYEELFSGVNNIMFRTLHRYNGTFERDGIPIKVHGQIGPCERAEIGELVIDASGNVHPCCQDINHSLIVGNVFHQNIDEIMFVGKHKEIIDGLRSGNNVPVCSNCDDCKYSSHKEMVHAITKRSSDVYQNYLSARSEIFSKQEYIDSQQRFLDENLNLSFLNNNRGFLRKFFQKFLRNNKTY